MQKYFIVLMVSCAALAADHRPDGAMANWKLQQAGELGLALQVETNGVRIRSLYDTRNQRELLATNQPPLFILKLRGVPNKKEVDLTAEQGWQKTTFRATSGGFTLKWEKPLEAAYAGLMVIATARLDTKNHAILWQLQANNPRPDWSVWRVSFPRIALANLGKGSSMLFPRGPGEVQQNVAVRPFSYRGSYPSGWCSMQFMAAYQEAGPMRTLYPGVIADSTPRPAISQSPYGLYFAVHDPWGSTKDLGVVSQPESQSIQLFFDHPAPNMGMAGNPFTLSGEGVWQLLRGDWFDAATIYKNWVRQKARWWPVLNSTGRKDTPTWMRELNAWAMISGAPGDCVARVQQFQQTLGVPVGFHWYNWHQIPFDNDYPHYFPAKPGFAEGVHTLQNSGVMVMPYINGRLWDTQDQGAQDFEFTQRALPASTKGEDGKPRIESYGSKETNGSPVRLAVMCPSTPLWQQTVQNTVLKLLQEIGTRAVYIDQVAAASPALCLDASHGHPLGGGHWWNEGYWKMLSDIRRIMPRGSMLTTECNGEPFIRWFDGYLTWHWQYDGQVPAFPAIYGGAIQMFGRAYRGGATKDLALRMKAGQQLVFGEQIGWLDPKDIQDVKNAEFFRQVVRVRDHFREYFYRGEMARPPRLTGVMSQVKADWQWSGEWWVTTDAVLTGAWLIPKEKRLVLLLVNVSDDPISVGLRFNALQYGIHARQLRGTRYPNNEATPAALSREFEQPLQFLPRQAQAWELRW